MVAIVIPAYKPGGPLIELARALHASGWERIVVVDDGSDGEYAGIFRQLEERHGCVVHHHARNMGKGAALKIGMRTAIQTWPDCEGFVTADADGQHSADDIGAVANALGLHPDSLILGVRAFGGEGVPARSRIGNRAAAIAFRLSTGRRCSDTQTGLRGLPGDNLSLWLETPGERFEYEMNLLMRAAKRRMPIVEVPIRTIYLDGNSASHYRPFRDTMRIVGQVAKFALSSIGSALIDLTAFTLLSGAAAFGTSATGLLAATAIARTLSGIVNFLLNRRVVFRSKEGAAGQAAKYLLLFCTQMLASWGFVSLLTAWGGLHQTAAKIFVDGALFLVSYAIQRRFVFAARTEQEAA